MRTKAQNILCFGILLFTLVLSSCLVQLFEPNDPSPDPIPDAVDLSGELQRATPESQGFRSERLVEAYEEAREIPRLKSLLVIRNGFLVAEEYFGETKPDDVTMVWGMANAIISTSIGLAIAEGFIESESSSISDFIPSEFGKLDEAKAGITLRDLLTMTSGIEWKEAGGPEFSQWIDSNDHTNYILNKPVDSAPGAVFNYNSGTVHLLSVILSEATGMSTREFAEQHFLRYLDISDRNWHLDSDNRHLAHGIHLRPIDMAKLGVFYLQGGKSGDRRIVPFDWSSKSWGLQFRLNHYYGPLRNLQYGYLWWVEETDLNSVKFAWGFAGQFIYCVPERNLVVITTADWRLTQQEATEQEKVILDLINKEVMPAVRPISSFSGN
ncbi:beta-lactamase family protein [bacterium]|nr:beta-lactamase family protein [bacterium]